MGVTRYFDAFPITDYQFGDEKFNIPIQNLAIYADVIDQVRRTAATYQNYDVLPGERPDQVSYKLYGTTDYHWTFFLMNDKLRERGWPLSPLKAEELAKKEYKERIVTTQTSLISNCEVGTAVIGTLSGATGTVVHRDINLGQLWLDNSSTTLWTAGETINSTNKTPTETIIALSSELRYQTVHHYVDGNGEWSDITQTDPRPGALTEVSWQERLNTQNNELKSIIALKSEVIGEVVKSFREAIRS